MRASSRHAQMKNAPMQFKLHGAIKDSTYFQYIQQCADLVCRPTHLQPIAGSLKISVILLFYTPIQKLRFTVAL